MKVIANAFRIRNVPSTQTDGDVSVLAELVPTVVLLNRKPNTSRVGDYLLVDHHQYEGSLFDPKSWDGVYSHSRDK